MGVIQRSPRGLLELLSAQGIENLPSGLLRDIYPTIDLLQFYGLQQQQVLVATNAALAEGAFVQIVGGSDYAVLFGASVTIGKTATMTAARIRLTIIRNSSNGLTVIGDECGPFGATETGPVTIGWCAPYPMLLPPQWAIRCFLEILGTDATASCSVTADVGILG